MSVLPFTHESSPARVYLLAQDTTTLLGEGAPVRFIWDGTNIRVYFMGMVGTWNAQNFSYLSLRLHYLN
jgi:hypothetical protein